MSSEEVFKTTFKTNKLRNTLYKDTFFKVLNEHEVTGSSRYFVHLLGFSVSFTRTTGIAKVTGRYGTALFYFFTNKTKLLKWQYILFSAFFYIRVIILNCLTKQLIWYTSVFDSLDPK